MDSSESIHTCIRNILQHDDTSRHDLKPWRRRIRDVCSAAKANYIEHLGKPIEAWPACDRFIQFIDDKQPVAAVVPEETINVDLEDLRTKNKVVLDAYTDAMNKMFTAYDTLDTKITELEDLEQEFVELTCVNDEDTSVAGRALQTSIEAFIQYKYESSDIALTYVTFEGAYKAWRRYRDVVLQAHAMTDLSGSVCGICTAEKLGAALVPCGHTYCNGCAQKQKKHCFICRADVKSSLRIFFN